MGREVRRVPLDFDWPLNKVWEGFKHSAEGSPPDCTACGGTGYSPLALELKSKWYGDLYDDPIDPADYDSEPFTAETPEVRAFAERNVTAAPEYYGYGEAAVRREATRLAGMWNRSWCHHLRQIDVDVLVEEGRLREFTHDWTRENGWQRKDPIPEITAREVNLWALSGFGHDEINGWLVIRAECRRQGDSGVCSVCDGHGSVEEYEGQREAYEAWERTDPPSGEGWQLWETVSEGSPISPVFATAEELAVWMSSPAYTWGVSDPMPLEQARRFVEVGWAPSLVERSDGEVVPGERAY